MNKKKLIWSDELISKYWQHLRQQKNNIELSFSCILGRTLPYLLKKYILSSYKNRQNISLLDYSCGEGTFLESVLKDKLFIEGYGLEFSEELVPLAEEKLLNLKNFRKVYSLEEKNNIEQKFDILTCFEVIEHLNDEYLASFLIDVKKYLKDGGFFLFTTPNNEILSESMQYCPQCDHTYHQRQHERSFSMGSLSTLLGNNNLKVYKIFVADLIVLEKMIDFTHNPFKNFKNLIYLVKPLLRKIRKREKPNLVVIGQYINKKH